MALTANQVQQFYIGYYARPADPVSLTYWQGQTEAAALAGFAGSAEFTNQFTGMSTSQQVTKVYGNLLGRAPDAAGLLYWSGEIAAGRETIGSLVLSMINNALGKDVTTIADRVTYSNAFTAAVNTVDEINAYAGPAATQAARDALLKVVSASTGDHTALTAETAKIDTTIAAIVSGGTSNPGQTFTLTTGQDTIVGTTGNDTVTGDHTTLQATDSINGGTGTDTFNYTDARTTAVAGDKMPAALVSNVEIINVRNVNGSAAVAATKESVTLNFTAITGSVGATLAPNTTVTLTAGASTKTFTLAGHATVALTSSGADIATYFSTNLPTGYEFVSLSGSQLVIRAIATGNADDVSSVFTPGVGTGVGAATGTGAVPTLIITQGSAGTASNGVADTVEASNFAGATDFNSNLSTNAVDFTKLANGQKVGLIGNGATELGAVSAGYNASATGAIINVTGGVGPTGTVAPAVTVTGTILANATINSTGAANKVGAVTLSGTETAVTINAATNLTAASLVDAGLKTLTISGAATSVAITAALASTVLTSVDASGLTAGGAKVGIGANLATTFKGGAGNDTVTILQNAAMTGTVDGGAGVNTLSISSNVNGADTSLVAATASKFTNFQTLQVAANGAAGDKSVFDGSLLTVTNFNVGASTGGVSITNLAAAPTINVVGAVAGTAGLELGFKTPSATNADVANLVFNNANVLTTGNVAGTSLSVLKLGTSDATLNITSSGSIIGTGAANTITTLTAADTGLKQINITGNQAFSLTTGALTKSFNIDGSTATGQLTIDASLATAGTTAVNINGGSNNDTIKASTLTTTATADLIYGGGGGDAITLGAAHTAKNTLVYKAASDSLLDVVGVSGAGTTVQKNVGKMDVITNFISGTDKIDVSAFAFAGAQKGAVINDAYASNALMVAAVNGAAGTNFFNDASATARAVKVVTDGTDTFVFVDANKDGSFNAATDMVIKLIGAAVPVIADISF